MADYNITGKYLYGGYREIFGLFFYPGPDGGIAFRTMKRGNDLESRVETETINHSGDFAINEKKDRASSGIYKIKPDNSPRENTHTGLLSFRKSVGSLKINGIDVCELVGTGYVVEVFTDDFAKRYSWMAPESENILRDFRKLHGVGESAAAA